MTDTFRHKFGGWHKANAQRWINADGSPGGIVAISASVNPAVLLPEGVEVWPDAKIIGDGASIGDDASIGPRASIGFRASIGSGASICSGARIGDDASICSGAVYNDGDWMMVAGPQGSRNAYATAVYSKEHGLRWWVGCHHGLSTADLLDRIENDHGATAHGDDYRALVAFAEGHPGLARHKEKLKP